MAGAEGGSGVTTARTLRVLFLSTLPVEGPSSRPRLHAYEPFLRRSGIEPTYASILSSAAMRRFYDLGSLARGRRLAAAAAGGLGRLWRLLRLGGFDVVVVHRDLLPRGNGLALRLLERSATPWVYDFDDALYLSPRDHVDTSETSHARMSRGKDPGEVRALIAAAPMVLAGNATLAAAAGEWNSNVRVLPTPVDTDRFHPPLRPRAHDELPEVGWIGSPTAAYCIRGLAGALTALGRRRRFVVRVTGAGEPLVLTGVDVHDLDWSLETEAAEYRRLTAGLYPLPDNPWTRGKCGYKALVYMASGAVPVVSPVGVNAELVEHGVTGFHAATEDEWVDALDTILADPELRATMSVKARAHVEEHYSVRACQATLVAALREIAGLE